MTPLEPTALACLERTRAAVANVLVLAALGIAGGGLLLRWRAGQALPRAPESVRQALEVALFGLIASSILVRRWVGSRSGLRDPSRRAARFSRAHLSSAAIGALAVPLGLVYGWTVRPRLDAVGPFWVAAVALGALAWPRATELEGFDAPMPEPNEPTP
jgi:hypothetical protein